MALTKEEAEVIKDLIETVANGLKLVTEAMIERTKALEQRIETLESRATPHQSPTIPIHLDPFINPKNCPKCGLALDRVMGYVCNNNFCPTGLGGVWGM